jgi:ADP-ribosylation factor family
MSYVTRKNGIKINFTDVGGAKASRRSWKQFYSSTDILVFKYKLNLFDDLNF